MTALASLHAKPRGRSFARMTGNGVPALALALTLPLAVLAGQPALAQAGAPPAEKPVTAPSQVDPGQLNVLPSAGNAGRSAAPTMIFDCKERPNECTKPLSPGDRTTQPETSPAPSNPASNPARPAP